MAHKCILICEDDEGIIEIAQIVLEDKGYRVVTQTDSNLVYNQVDQVQPDLILLDLWMNGLRGDEITRHLKTQAATRHIPVIIMSASKDTEQIARQAGADAFLAKPFDLDTLENVVGKYVRV